MFHLNKSGSGCALLCSEVLNDKQWEVYLLLQNVLHDFKVIARQVLVQSSYSSRARSKRAMNQIMFDVSDPLVVR